MWEHGEWLELCSVRSQDQDLVLTKLKIAEQARSGTTRQQKYVAFCLIGQLADPGSALVNQLADLCVAAVKSETDPGVVSAAWWAAGRLGRDVRFQPGDHVLVDENTGLTFVKIPRHLAFRPPVAVFGFSVALRAMARGLEHRAGTP